MLIATEYLNRFTSGIYYKPDYSIHFPAKLITTQLSWDDLVLAPEVLEEIENITTWLKYSAAILQDWDLAKAIKPGYRSLFHGPPGTGKTLTATLIALRGCRCLSYRSLHGGLQIYRRDGKNLANVFDQAQHKN